MTKRKYSKLLILFVCCSLSSCATREGDTFFKDYKKTQATWDGDNQNSGLISYSNEYGFELTQRAADRYIKLTTQYSTLYSVTPGEGLKNINNRYFLNAQYLQIFISINNES